MDVGELLSYKPENVRKRKQEEEERPFLKAKKKVFDEEPPEVDERAQIMEILEKEPEEEPLDDASLKKMILQFEKRVLKNQEMRIKFPDLPEKFMESEMELNDVILQMHVIATMPDLYHILVELNAVQSLLQLLSHDNTDISIAVVDLLQELTDVDTLNENDEDADVLVDALLDGQVIAVLVQNLERLDETVKEEADGVHNSLGLVENVTDFRPEVCPDAAKQGLLQWLLKRLKMKAPFDSNKLYASEILAILLQNHEENRQFIGEIDGIDVLLQQLAVYKKHDPNSNEESELMENLFNCLCSSLMLPSNRERFLKGEGLQLMKLMLREKKQSRFGAIRVLDHAMTGSEGKDNCQTFVDILGLKCIFPIFMKTPKIHKKGGSAEDTEEHVISIVASLLKNCQATQRQRVFNKYTENDHEKVDRLMELHFKYLDKVRSVDQQIEREKKTNKYSEDEEEEMEETFYLRRLDAGLFTLQHIDYIMLELCVNGASTVKQRVMQMLNMRGGSVKTIRSVIREYAGNIGDAKDPEKREEEQNRILGLLEKF